MGDKVLELAVFRLFEAAAPLGVDRTSISQPDPPAPDILCRSTSGEWIAFELVELVDPSIRRSLAIMRR